MRRLLLLVGLAGCGFDRLPGGPADAPPPDGRPDAPRAPLGPWREPVLVAELNSTANDDDPSLTADLLEVYFGSTRIGGQGNEDIWVAKRASPDTLFGPPIPVDELNSIALDSNVEVSADGLTITFTSLRGGDADIYISKRASRAELWSPPVLADGLNRTGAGDWGTAISADGLSAVLCSDRGGNEALYTTQRARVTDPWETPQPISGIETTADECDGMLADPTTLYFTRNALAGLPDLDLYVAQWNGTTFGPADRLDMLDTPSRDSDPWVSPDQRMIFFSSNRSGGPGFDDIYMSSR